MRCFIGSFVPIEFRQKLQLKRPELKGVRWTKPHKLHMTFEFYPDLHESELDATKDKVSELARHFPIQCRTIAFTGFPRSANARVLVVRVDLQSAQDILFSDSDAKPHITVGYARRRRIKFEEESLELTFNLDTVHLIESKDGKYRVVS